MNILGIETSSPVCSVGFVNKRGWSVERNLEDPHIHSEKLLTLTKEVLRQAEIGFESLDAIGVSTGPGSFTGLRIGLSTAKGLCYALNCRLIEVSTFEAIAQAALDSSSAISKVSIAVDAKQGEFYVGSLVRNGESSAPTVKVRIERLEEIVVPQNSASNAVWITDRPEVLRDCGVPAELIRGLNTFCRGDVVARLAAEKFRTHEFADLAAIEPLYLKDFVVKKALS